MDGAAKSVVHELQTSQRGSDEVTYDHFVAVDTGFVSDVDHAAFWDVLEQRWPVRCIA